MESNSSNFDQSCRICLETNQDLMPLFSSISFSNKEISIPDLLSRLACQTASGTEGLQLPSTSIFQVSRGTAFPNQICPQCVALATRAFELKIKFERSTEKLEDLLSASVKVQETDLLSDNDTSSQAEEVIEIRLETDDGKRENYSEKLAVDVLEGERTNKFLRKCLNIPKESEKRHFRPKSVLKRQKILQVCPFCDDEFSEKEFRVHVRKHREHDGFRCNKCDRVFKEYRFLKIHQNHHEQKLPYRCKVCNKGFVLKSNYDCHTLIHSEAELPHPCQFCDKRFANPTHLKRHLLIHTENRSYALKYRVNKCRLCSGTFGSEQEKTHHKCSGTAKPRELKPNVKKEEGKFRCQSCYKAFHRGGSLYNHVQTIHMGKVRRTLCSVCGRNVTNISYHMRRHNEIKPHECKLCSKRFSMSTTLRKHLLVHSGEKPFVCSVCAKAFNNLYNLQVHERIHAGNRCHVCTVCGKGFLEMSYMKKHMRKVHNACDVKNKLEQ